MCVFTCAFWSLGSGHEQRWRLPHLRHKHAPQTDISLGTQEVLNGKRNQKSKKRRKVEKKWIFIPPPFILVPVFFPLVILPLQCPLTTERRGSFFSSFSLSLCSQPWQPDRKMWSQSFSVNTLSLSGSSVPPQIFTLASLECFVTPEAFWRRFWICSCWICTES